MIRHINRLDEITRRDIAQQHRGEVVPGSGKIVLSADFAWLEEQSRLEMLHADKLRNNFPYDDGIDPGLRRVSEVR